MTAREKYKELATKTDVWFECDFEFSEGGNRYFVKVWLYNKFKN